MYAALGATIPESIKIACGWSGLGMEEYVKGATYARNQSVGGMREIFISPAIDDPLEVFGLIVHEATHALLPHNEDHGPVFKMWGTRLGLEGAPEQMLPGVELTATLASLLARADAYPHSAMKPPPAPPGQIIVVTINDKGEETRETQEAPPMSGGEGEGGGTQSVGGVSISHHTRAIAETGAQLLTAACPTCKAQIWVEMRNAMRGMPLCGSCHTPYKTT